MCVFVQEDVDEVLACAIRNVLPGCVTARPTKMSGAVRCEKISTNRRYGDLPIGFGATQVAAGHRNSAILRTLTNLKLPFHTFMITFRTCPRPFRGQIPPIRRNLRGVSTERHLPCGGYSHNPKCARRSPRSRTCYTAHTHCHPW